MTETNPQEALAELDHVNERIADTRHVLAKLEAQRDEVLRRVLVKTLAAATQPTLEAPPSGGEEPRTAWERLIGRTPSPAIADVVAVVRRAGQPVSTETVATELAISMETAAVRLSRAVKDGFLQRVKRGLYEALEEFGG